MSITVKALPGRVLMKFPEPVTQIGSIIVPEESSMRAELAELYDIGASVDDDQAMKRREIVTHAKAGGKFLIPMSLAAPLYRKELGPEFKFLEYVRCYRIEEISVAVYVDGTEPA